MKKEYFNFEADNRDLESMMIQLVCPYCVKDPDIFNGTFVFTLQMEHRKKEFSKHSVNEIERICYQCGNKIIETVDGVFYDDTEM